MCNKYDMKVRSKELLRLMNLGYPMYKFRLDDSFKEDYPSDYFYPAGSVPALITDEDEDTFKFINTIWGIPTKIQAGPKTFTKPLNNKRDDKLNWKYAGLLKRSRCILPMSSIIEWPKDTGGSKYPVNIPYRITPVDDVLFFSAGLIEKIEDKIYSTMITTSPSGSYALYHDRMPAILTMDNAMDYLTGETELARNLIGPSSGEDIIWKGEMLLDIMGKTESEKLKKKSKYFPLKPVQKEILRLF